MTIDPSMLESVVRGHLNLTAPRTMVVLEPLKINILNLVDGVVFEMDVPDFPDAPDKGSHKIAFGRTIYIERSDFREDNTEKGYRRLAPGQSVGLRHAGYVIKVVKVHKSGNGVVSCVDAECVLVNEVEEKPKAFIHWVGGDPVQVEVRLYERLFKHKNPEDPAVVPGGFLTDVDSDSKKVIRTSLADRNLKKVAKVFDRFQFERVGFFSVDQDSNDDMLVLNRTVSLKEDSKKV